ncbi:MAG: leucyl aminopeptidase [Legionellales bacterium RIFCSPHIGHO2_12_FULL_42_9]|nr:MAG: leucyl aminopeptidase [Legionellales bacterium RIFCSPHIGHO2_12_FULL_42_9]
MQYLLSNKIKLMDYECVVLGFCDNTDFTSVLQSSANTVIEQINRLRKKCLAAGDWTFQSESDHNSLLIFNCGNASEFNEFLFNKYLTEIMQFLLKQKIKTTQIYLPLLPKYSTDWHVKQMLLKFDAQCYCFNEFKTQNKPTSSLKIGDFCIPNASQKTLEFAIASASGISLTRWLADLPANRCTPSFLANTAMNLANQHPSSITTKVMYLDEIKQLGMGAFLAVAQGSNEPPCFIELAYKGAAAGIAPVVLVGKGITFDSGGISIKPSLSMEEMKYDMAGAASVLGVIKACALLKLPINVIGLIPSTENMPSGTAIKPGDVVTSMSGQTIEIVNTDAEGRLILADALTYAERYHPKFVVDLATLTGAVVIALGYVMTGFMTTDSELAKLITQASCDSGDKVWQLPLDNGYNELIESTVADVMNVGADRSAGSISAAAFLALFAKKYRWAHFDIAGTAWISGRKRQATGRPVSLLIELLANVAQQ